MSTFKTTVWWFALCVFASGWMGFAYLDGALEEARAQRDDAERRMGECIDIASDARDEALMSETAWDRAVSELSYCMLWEGHQGGGMNGGQCLGLEYWTSYNAYAGPG